ncbi:uncharacterized protein MYCFIDRAFT_175666 [Pseudocercospora fijiensis CIRAD86]|uniref:Uncharacterized protein n=1 Tax=Pseudocercospora fijiensis (strain CIRAD86) TaxID=383855 RepID=M3AC25_PSEFD|nr:uncharacterized protein MYCFIDRAFT_175666 [Pseudocercospora fijiensis CIRAD86]EME82116.1 hypothetical protein MYCFIDRAFT_175666 [Pseudocercospora fijiensis CIRAD86]
MIDSMNFSGHASLTPPISRTCHLLRHETIPIYASNSQFIFNIDDAAALWSRGTQIWANLLLHRDINIGRSLNQCDGKGMLDSTSCSNVAKCQNHIRRQSPLRKHGLRDLYWLRRQVYGLDEVRKKHLGDSDSKGLLPDDMRFLMQAMDIVATHPVLDLGLQRRQNIWLSMEDKLNKLIDACKHGSIAAPAPA